MDIHRALIRKCKNGDRESFDLLIQKLEQPLYRVCYGYVRNSDEALDILQEVYIKLFRFIQQYDEDRPFLPWAKQIAARTCLNYSRDHHKHRHLSLESPNEQGMTLLDQLPDPTSWENQCLNHDLLSQCLQRLPDSYRITVSLHYMEQMSYQEVAAVLDKPVGTVKSDLHRARQLLLKYLSQAGWMEV